MIGKNNHYLKNTKEGTKVESYSIKKFKVGTASVVIGASIFFGAGAVAQASEEVSNNTISDNTTNSNISEGVAGTPVATEQPVAKDTTKEDVASAVASKLNATEKETLDKTSLTKLIEEIDGKFSNGKYNSKTEESVNRLKAVLEEARIVLNNAATQAELTKAQARLATATTQLKTKPTEKKETPEVDTTNGKPTIGKKAENTEKATDSNSIANSGTRDERNGKALNKENAFRTDGTTTDNDPSANQTYKAPSADASLEELATTLKNLPDKVENNAKIKNMNEVGASTGVAVGEVKEIHDFGGWTAVDVNGQAGKFAIARKTDKGVFPIETINVLGNNDVWTIEQSFDRTNDYMLFLSKVRTKANSTEESFDNRPYIASGEGGPRGASVARGTKGFRGIEKVFKAYSSKEGSKVQVSFKTGYTGDINGTKAQYKVEVFTDQDGFTNPIYSTSFSPQNAENGVDKTVVAAEDGTTRNKKINIGNKTKQEAETLLSQATNMPNGTGGSFTSREIELPKGVTSYKVRISSADDEVLGMSYQSRFLQYALPVTGLDFSITQNTNQIAKDLLQKVYDKLEASKPTDSQGKTPSSVEKYENKLKEIKALLDKGTLDTTEAYKTALSEVLLQKKELVDKGALTEAIAKLRKLTEEADPADKTSSSLAAYTNAKEAGKNEIKEAQKVIDRDDVTKSEVLEALIAINDKKADLERAKAGLADKVTDEQKTALGQAEADLTVLDDEALKGKTKETADAYKAEVGKLQTAIAAAKQEAAAIVADADNKTQAEAALAQAKVDALKAKLAEEKAKLVDKADKAALTEAKTALDTQTKEEDPTGGKTTSTAGVYTAAKEAAEAAVREAEAVIAKDNATPKEVAEALAKVNDKKADLERAKAGLVEAATQDQKDELANADEDLKLADTAGKTNDSIKVYNEEVGKLSAELEATKQAAKDLLAKGDNAGELEAYRLQAKISKLKSKLLEAAKLLKDIDKSAVKKEVEETAKNATDAIVANNDLTPEQKEAAKAKVAEEANKAIATIDKATTEDDVTAAKNSAKLAIAKELAKAELEAAKAIKEKAIAGNDKLSDDEKQAVKEQIKNIVDEAKEAIDNATEQSAVDTAKTTAKEDIDALNPVGKDKAKETIDSALSAKGAAIDSNDKLSDVEKSAAKEAAKKAAEDAKKAIDKAISQAEVDDKVTEGTKAISSVAEVGKDKAKEAIDSALSAKEAAIDSNDKLSDVEKSAAKEAVKKAAEDAKKVIDKATTQAEVEEKLSAGLKAISDVTPIAKAKAIEEIEKAKKAKEEAIDANSQLLDEEKDELKEKIAEEAKKAIEKIIAATTESHVTLETNSGKEEISKVKNEDNYKEKAKKDVQEKLAEKLAEIEAMPALTKVQKEKEKSKAETEAKKALAAIDDSKTTTKEEVDKEVRNFIYRILGAILDIEDYDLSKLLVKGTVEIEQGKEISDSDILSKIDLPSDVKVKNIEKPSTEQLGKVLSRVTLILVDNSTLTIDVPVEVVQAHTTPDEKPSTELAKFKELAKQDVKEKLAGKLSELEQATNLTESQKQAMVNKLKESAEKAISDIEKASSKEAVEQVLRKFILAVKPEVLEKEEYDLSKELVNGRLVVKRGDKLSDEDILAKINLPKGAEVINIEKPTTLALGKTQARVELKLSDGTIITIEVPIEVIKGESALSEMKRSPEQTSANEQVSTNITSKKLPNTGATETNTGLAGLGLGIFGGLLAVAKRRRERKED